jgi:hypothetical protein
MAWIYLAESEDSPKPWKATSGRSPIVRTTDTLRPSFFQEWRAGTCRSRPSGTTSKQSIKRTLPPPKLSMADSPARTFQLQAAARAWTASAADYSLRSLGLSASYDRPSSSWRTSQRLLFEEQNELLGNFAASGMTVDGAFYPLRTWARITDAKDGGSWRTPLGTNGEKMGHGNLPHQVKWATPSAADAVGSHGGGQGRSLRTDIYNWKKQTWPTPQAHDSAPGNPKRVGRFGTKHGGRNLNDWAAMWPTPRASSANGPGIHGTGGIDLQTAVTHWPTPQARDHRTGQREESVRRARKEAMGWSPNLNDKAAPGGQLNPTWVEWLMGYPSEWTVLEDWATQWFRPKRGKRSKG